MSVLILFWFITTLVTTNGLTVNLVQRTSQRSKLFHPSIGISFEFFKFPEYVTENPSTKGCLANLQAAQGGPPPIRIGGNTADYATYDPLLDVPVTYPPLPTDGRGNVVFGPQFIKLASQMKGNVVINLNRRSDNLTNTVLAAKAVVKTVSNLDAIEIGNEPDIFKSDAPIVQHHSGVWTAATERQTQLQYQKSVASAVGKASKLFQAGVYAFYESQFGIPELAKAIKASAKSKALVKYFSVHHYANSAKVINVTMNHAFIVNDVADVRKQFNAATSFGVPGRYGEANSHATGGIEGLSNTFGAALWTMDFTFQALINGAQLINFHQRENVTCRYCWWKHQYVESPFYGGYAVATALNGADTLAMLDDGTSNYAAYALFANQKPIRAVFINSDFYSPTYGSPRSSQVFTLQGLPNYIASASGRRLTAPFATSITEQGEVPTYAGQTFEDGTCKLLGTATIESFVVSGGEVSATVAASEAIVVDFKST